MISNKHIYVITSYHINQITYRKSEFIHHKSQSAVLRDCVALQHRCALSVPGALPWVSGISKFRSSSISVNWSYLGKQNTNLFVSPKLKFEVPTEINLLIHLILDVVVLLKIRFVLLVIISILLFFCIWCCYRIIKNWLWLACIALSLQS